MADGTQGPSRRGLIGGAMLLMSGTALHVASPAGQLWPRERSRARRSVVAFHADQLYFDYSGKDEPFVPPPGLRSLDGHDQKALSYLVYAI